MKREVQIDRGIYESGFSGGIGPRVLGGTG